LFIAMRAFYGLSLWITPHLLFTYPDLHHRLLGFRRPTSGQQQPEPRKSEV
jgi:hypothetical protein